MNLLKWDPLRKHDLELILCLNGLRCSLAFGRGELAEVGFGLGLGRCWRDSAVRGAFRDDVIDRAALEGGTKLFNLSDQLVGACFDGHSGHVVSEREKSAFALHPRKAYGELDFGNGETVAGMESAVHVGVCEAAEEFGVLFMELVW